MSLDNRHGEPQFRAGDGAVGLDRFCRENLTYGATAREMGVTGRTGSALVPPRSYTDFLLTLRRMWHAMHELDRARQRQQRELTDVTRLVNLIRGIHATVEVLRVATVGLGSTLDRPSALPQAARRLYDRAEERIGFADPLDRICRSVRASTERKARDLMRFLGVGGSAEHDLLSRIRAVMDDSAADDVWKQLCLNASAAHVEVAVVLLESTPLEATSASLVEEVLETQSASPGNSVLSVVLSGLGNTEKGVAYRALLVRHFAARALGERGASPSAAGRVGRLSLRRLLLLSEDDVSSISGALGRATAADSASAQMSTEQVLTRSVRRTLSQPTSRRVVNVLAIAQALIVLCDHATEAQRERPGVERAMRSAELGGSMLALGEHGLELLAYGAIRGGRLLHVRVGGFVYACEAMSGVASRAGNALGCIGGVLSILHGVIEIRDGVDCNEVDVPKVTLGALEIASGVLAIAGILMSAPGLQLAAVAVAIPAVAYALYQANQPEDPPACAALKTLCQSLGADGHDAELARLIRVAGLASEVQAVRDAADRWRVWTVGLGESVATRTPSAPRSLSYQEQRLYGCLEGLGLERVAEAIFLRERRGNP